MRAILDRFSSALHLIVSIIAPLLSAFYVNLLSTRVLSKDSKIDILEGIISLGWWNLLLLIAAGLLFFQFFLFNRISKRLQDMRDYIISRILHLACVSLVYPRTLGEVHIRALISLTDADDPKFRTTTHSFNAEPDPERQARFPVDFGITGEAIVGKQVVLKQLPKTHHSKYEPEVQKVISKNVRTVLAAPIFDPNRRGDDPLGVVAFDSFLSIDELGFNNQDIRSIAQHWADIIGEIITQKKGDN